MGTQPFLPQNGLFLLWPNGWMHQDATWYGGRPQPRWLCVRWGPSPLPKKGADTPIFGPRLLWPNGCMDKDATWYRGRSQFMRHCVRWGPSSSSPKGAQPPNFRPMSVVAKWLDVLRDATLCGVSPRPRRLCVRWGHPQLPPEKRAHHPPPNFWPMSIVAKRLKGSRCHLVRR